MKLSSPKGAAGSLYVVFTVAEGASIGLVSDNGNRMFGRLGCTAAEEKKTKLGTRRLLELEKLFALVAHPTRDVRGLLAEMFVTKTMTVERFEAKMAECEKVPDPMNPGHTKNASWDDRLQHVLNTRDARPLAQLAEEWDGSAPESSPAYHTRLLNKRMLARFIKTTGAKTTHDFTVENLRRHLNELLPEEGCSFGTRRNHRGGLSTFAEFLIGKKLLSTNIVLTVTIKTLDPDVMYAQANDLVAGDALTEEEQMRHVSKGKGPAERAVFALIHAACVEFSAIRHTGSVTGPDGKKLKDPVLFKKDFKVDPKTHRFTRWFFARGPKASLTAKRKGTSPRNRWCEVKRDWAWDLYIEPYLRSLRWDDAFAPKSYMHYIRAWDQALKDAGLWHKRKKGHAMHLGRHSYLTQEAESGVLDTEGGLRAAQQQAGHRDGSRVTFNKYVKARQYQGEGVLMAEDPGLPKLKAI